MTRATRQLCLVIVSVLLAGPAADGQTEPAPQQTSNLTTVLRNLWPLLAPSSTGNTEGGDPAQSRTNPKDAVPAVEPPSVGVASPGPETSLNPAVARGKIEALLGRNCVACHGPNNPVVPQFVVTPCRRTRRGIPGARWFRGRRAEVASGEVAPGSFATCRETR
jgi:hypothetical protein